jgi:hypothetical protein
MRAMKRLSSRALCTIVTVALLLAGCASDPSKLTRERAAALIDPQLVDVHPSLRASTGTMTEFALPNEDRALVAIGAAHMTIVNNPYIGREIAIALTKNGRELATTQKWRETQSVGLVLWEIPLGSYKLDAVTGIQQPDKAHALVTFTYETIPNDMAKRIIAIGHLDVVHAQSPLAALANAPGSQAQQAQANATTLLQVMGVNSNPTFEDVFKKTNSATLPLTLYDDGWRVGQ